MARFLERTNSYARKIAAGAAVATAVLAPFSMHIADQKGQYAAQTSISAGNGQEAFDEGRVSFENQVMTDVADGAGLLTLGAGMLSMAIRREHRDGGAGIAAAAIIGALLASATAEYAANQIVDRDVVAVQVASGKSQIIAEQQALNAAQELQLGVDIAGIALIVGLGIGAATAGAEDSGHHIPPAAGGGTGPAPTH